MSTLAEDLRAELARAHQDNRELRATLACAEGERDAALRHAEEIAAALTALRAGVWGALGYKHTARAGDPAPEVAEVEAERRRLRDELATERTARARAEAEADGRGRDLAAVARERDGLRAAIAEHLVAEAAMDDDLHAASVTASSGATPDEIAAAWGRSFAASKRAREARVALRALATEAPRG